MKLSAACLITGIDKFTESTGKAVSWLVLGMVLLICYDVAMRYLFQQGSV
ncbi:MAG: C4-dicarboxylate ABC transporter permease, partial [Methylophaga sp.]|nr:C4-dicarboxylate ABC transporter permease [Methylophaga sp.]